MKELLALLQDYECRHPRLFGMLLRATGYLYDSSLERPRVVAQVLRGVAFRPREGE
jgi:hypothetical protein